MGVPIAGATYINSNSMFVINMPLNQNQYYKKNNAVINTVQESVATGGSLYACINGNENTADLLTKVLWHGKQRNSRDTFLHEVYNG